METQQAFQLPELARWTPKLHLSGAHGLLCFTSCQMGDSIAGLLSEDEVKSAHAEVNDLQRRYRREYELQMVRR